MHLVILFTKSRTSAGFKTDPCTPVLTESSRESVKEINPQLACTSYKILYGQKLNEMVFY